MLLVYLHRMRIYTDIDGLGELPTHGNVHEEYFSLHVVQYSVWCLHTLSYPYYSAPEYSVLEALLLETEVGGYRGTCSVNMCLSVDM